MWLKIHVCLAAYCYGWLHQGEAYTHNYAYLFDVQYVWAPLSYSKITSHHIRKLFYVCKIHMHGTQYKEKNMTQCPMLVTFLKLCMFSTLIFTTLSSNFRGCLLSSIWLGGEELLLIPQICTPSIDVSSCSWKTNKYPEDYLIWPLEYYRSKY